MRSSLEVYDLATGTCRVVLQSDALIEAPNWQSDGFLVNSDGRLFRVPHDNPRLVAVDTGLLIRCNNDHAFTRDGMEILFGCHRGHGAEVFAMPAQGGTPRLISPEPPTWLHGVAPDGSGMVYCAARGDKARIDVYTKTWTGPERRLTMGEGMCDGPDYAADGARIYYNCDRSGHAQIWVMNVDGTNQHQLFADDQVNWFPHPSPDGLHVLYLAYPPGTLNHPRDLPVALCLMDPDGRNRRRILEFTGGQGSINVPNWSPDGQHFAFIRYQQQEP
ncbi:MAG: PD40 domain-containing protein [Candidatus Saccharibacteria bacterium]|nr:PD40 domain-containing protein [Pseudorhodobacter sp.]